MAGFATKGRSLVNWSRSCCRRDLSSISLVIRLSILEQMWASFFKGWWRNREGLNPDNDWLNKKRRKKIRKGRHCEMCLSCLELSLRRTISWLSLPMKNNRGLGGKPTSLLMLIIGRCRESGAVLEMKEIRNLRVDMETCKREMHSRGTPSLQNLEQQEPHLTGFQMFPRALKVDVQSDTNSNSNGGS